MHEVLIIGLLLIGGGFLRVCVALQIFRYGLGLYGGGVGLLVIVFSIIMAIFIASPHLPVEKIFSASPPTYDTIQETLTPFLKKNSKSEDVEILTQTLQRLKDESAAPVIEENHLPTLLLAFSLGELREAFKIGLLFILPFILIDLVVVHILQLLAITQISAFAFTLPLKLILFLSIDGWGLITSRLISGYL
jgi:type III secretory pathway component EscR